MKKILPVVLVVVLLAGGYYLYSQKTQMAVEEKSVDRMMEVAKDSMKDASEESFTGDLKSLIARNIPMMCSYDVNGYKYNAWLKGTSIKSEYTSPEGIGTIIIKDNCMYTWLEGETQGVEFCFENPEEDIWDQAENLPSEYYCVPSLIGEATFDLPLDVEFLSFQDMMQDLENYTDVEM